MNVLRLKEVIKEKGYSVTSLADTVGVTQLENLLSLIPGSCNRFPSFFFIHS